MSTTHDSSDELMQRDEIRRLAEEFAANLRNGRQPSIDDYTVRVVPALQDNLREELVGEEFAHRFGDATKDGKLRYRPVATLGEGTFGAVYKALDDALLRPVAIKVLLNTEANAKQNFVKEVHRQANLKHHHLVAVHDAGTLSKGHAFAVMEYIDGATLRQKLTAAPLALETAARLMEQVAQAISVVHKGTAGTWAHRQPPLVHRDLKPENILIDGNGDAHVADFGLAAAVAELRDGTVGVGGTVPYMSPEQATVFCPNMAPVPIDTRSDVWALGVLLYEMLSGKQPFFSNGTEPQVKRDEIIRAIMYYEPQRLRDLNPSVPPDLEKLVDDCLKKNVAERVQSVAVVAERLRSWAIPPEKVSILGRIIYPFAAGVRLFWNTSRIRDRSRVLLSTWPVMPEVLIFGVPSTEQTWFIQIPLVIANIGKALVRNLALRILLPKALSPDLDLSQRRRDPASAGLFDKVEAGEHKIEQNLLVPSLRIDDHLTFPILLRIRPTDWIKVRSGAERREGVTNFHSDTYTRLVGLHLVASVHSDNTRSVVRHVEIWITSAKNLSELRQLSGVLVQVQRIWRCGERAFKFPLLGSLVVTPWLAGFGDLSAALIHLSVDRVAAVLPPCALPEVGGLFDVMAAEGFTPARFGRHIACNPGRYKAEFKEWLVGIQKARPAYYP